MQPTDIAKPFGTFDEVSEDGCHCFVAHRSVTFGVPLYADDIFHLIALNGLNNAIGRTCCHVEARTGPVYSLMVEGVDAQFVTKQMTQDAIALDSDRMCGDVAWSALAVFDGRG